MLGQWKNFEEIEENLTLAELEMILKASRKRHWDDRKFAAALKGVEMPDYNDDDEDDEEEVTFEDIQRRAEARIRGKSEESVEFEAIGFGYREE